MRTITRAPALPYVDLAPISDERLALLSAEAEFVWTPPEETAEIIRLTPRAGDITGEEGPQ